MSRSSGDHFPGGLEAFSTLPELAHSRSLDASFSSSALPGLEA